MPNVKISDAADAGTLLASDMLPLARSGNTNAYHATMTEVAAFASTSLASGAYGNVGRNLLHNPLFNVYQRGVGPWTTNGAFTSDRWWLGFATDTVSSSLISLTDGDRAQIGDEGAWIGNQAVFAGSPAAGAFSCLTQGLEDMRRFSNKTATVSFWAKAATGTPSLGVTWYQYFGSGGSPSAVVEGTGVAVTLSTTWTRYTRTIAFPSIAGKTLGTNGDSYTALRFGFSSGATNASFIGVGVQSGTISLWGVQLEIGSVATPLEKPDIRYDLANCQRFYQTGTNFESIGASAMAGWTGQHTRMFPTRMRATPTMTGTPYGASNTSGAAVSGGGIDNYLHEYAITAGGTGYASGISWTASADL